MLRNERGRENNCAQGSWEELGKEGVTWTEHRAPERAWWQHSQFNVPPSVTCGKWRVTFTSTHYYVYEESSHGYYKGVHHTSCHTHWFLNCAQQSPGFHCLEVSKTIPSFCNENSICFHNLKKEFGCLKYTENNQLKDTALAVSA